MKHFGDEAIKTLPAIAASSVGIAGSLALSWLIFTFVDRLNPVGLGAHGTVDTSSIRLYMAVATAFGVFSKIAYDFVTSSSFHKDLTNLRSFAAAGVLRATVLACVVSPLSMLLLYKTLAEINDSMLAFLLCYQNGFFFQSIMIKHPKSRVK